jgi:hypothetical protein
MEKNNKPKTNKINIVNLVKFLIVDFKNIYKKFKNGK